LKPVGSGFTSRVLACRQAFSANFPENDIWQASPDGLAAAVFRDGGSRTFPKMGLLGKVSASSGDVKIFEGWSVEPQIGATERTTNTLAQRIRDVMPDVLTAYPHARIEVTPHGLLLKPSPAAVPKTAVAGMRLIDSQPPISHRERSVP
jgi:hypothetical protein